MRFEKVDYIPRVRKGFPKDNPACRMLYGFVNSDIKMAKVVWQQDYKNVYSAYNSITAYVKRYYSGCNIHLCVRNNELYLVKGDLNELL